MTIPRVPTGTAQALSPGQRHALEHFYGALATRNVDFVDQALTSDWEDIPLVSPGSGCRARRRQTDLPDADLGFPGHLN